jgi:hypothetical protein
VGDNPAYSEHNIRLHDEKKHITRKRGFCVLPFVGVVLRITQHVVGMEAIVLKHDDSGAVLVQRGEFTAWIDVWVDEKYKDVCVDWNKYIFHLWKEQDLFEQEQQKCVVNFEEMTGAAVNHLEELGVLRYTDEEGYTWHKENLNQELCQK